MSCEGLPPESYGFYVLGTLTGPELSELQAHLDQNCSRCNAELAKARAVWHGVATAAPSVEPRKALGKRVGASVQDAEPEPFRIGWWKPLVVVATMLLAVLAGWELNVARRVSIPQVQMLPMPSTTVQALKALEEENRVLRDRLSAGTSPAQSRIYPAPVQSPKTNPLQADLDRSRAELVDARRQIAQQQNTIAEAQRSAAEANRRPSATAAPPSVESTDIQRQLSAAQTRAQQLEQDLAQYKSLLAIARHRLETPAAAPSLLADPNLKVVRLRSTANGSALEGHVLLSGGSQAIFYGSQLPALPEGRTYQLWLIRGTAPAIVSAGVFQPTAQGRATVRFESPTLTSGVTAIAVTDEPSGGSTTPTGHKLMIGS